jgi:hypothetical protein
LEGWYKRTTLKNVAKPIKPTPPLTGRDAEALVESLQASAPRDVMARRVDAAKAHLAAMTLPKGATAREKK